MSPKFVLLCHTEPLYRYNSLLYLFEAVIKTQPYDLLRWSAMYFRCLATDKVPPVKDRLETNCEHGRLTRGYLKVLLRQIGRGFHVTQETLQDFWKGLCLLEVRCSLTFPTHTHTLFSPLHALMHI